jgi:hypothetical protein
VRRFVACTARNPDTAVAATVDQVRGQMAAGLDAAESEIDVAVTRVEHGWHVHGYWLPEWSVPQ